jgi:ethanolamine utilization microcompartment shell protein EutS
VLLEADEFPPTTVGIDTNSLDVCDSAFSLEIGFFNVSTGAVLSTGHVSSVCIDMQRVALATVA